MHAEKCFDHKSTSNAMANRGRSPVEEHAETANAATSDGCQLRMDVERASNKDGEVDNNSESKPESDRAAVETIENDENLKIIDETEFVNIACSDETRHTGDESSEVANTSHDGDQVFIDRTEIEIAPDHRSTVADQSTVRLLSKFNSEVEKKLPSERRELGHTTSDEPSQGIVTTTTTTVSEIIDGEAPGGDGCKLPAQLLTSENLNEASETMESTAICEETVDCSMIDQLGSQTFRNEVSETEDAAENAPDFETYPPSKRQKLSEYLQSE